MSVKYQAHIYLIQDGKDIETNIFKIGKSKQGINDIIKLKRVKDYSTGTIQHNTWLVSYTLVDDIENKILKYFKNKYLLVRGREWYKGDIKQMKKDIDLIIDNYNTENYELLEPATKDITIQKLKTWRTVINHMSYDFIDEFFSNIFVNKEDITMFKEYIINILDNVENHYGVLIIPGFESGDILLDILRQLGDYYNRYDNPRDTMERLIRHDGDCSIKIIKENQHCHHVYLWCKDITDIKSSYKKNKINYTVCNIKDEGGWMNRYDDYKLSCGWRNDFIFSMLIDYLN